MSKRNQRFQRRAQDAYDTPESAVLPLLPHLPERFSFWEPCVGSGRLARHLHRLCAVQDSVLSDIEPRAPYVAKLDALEIASCDRLDLIITNPPWTRSLLHPMIDHFRASRPTWLLFDADWAHTRQAAAFLPYCRKIVSIGRVSWMENGTSGFDNCAWYLFGRDAAKTEFVGRSPVREVAA